jgi:hypothetical protein
MPWQLFLRIMLETVYEYRWKDDQSPYFRVIQNGVLTERPVYFGRNISVEVGGNIQCAGYEKDGVWNNCATGGAHGVRKCEECKKREGMPVAQYCDGFNTDMFSGEELEKLSCPHYVYLAFFDSGLIKVGVSSSERGYLRQIEQGSHYTMIVAEGMWGVPARQFETILRKAGIIDKIQSSQKKDALLGTIDKKAAQKEMEELLAKYLPAVLAQRPDFEQYLKKPAEVFEWSEKYHLQEAKKSDKPIHSTDLGLGESVSGTLLSAKGSFLVLETDAERVILDAKKLKGYRVDFSAKALGLQKEQAFQGALF